MPPPPPPSPLTGPSPAFERSKAPAYLVLAGGIAVVLGVFLPWITLSGPTVLEHSINGLKIGTWGTLILGGFGIMRGIAALSPGPNRLGTPVITGALIGVLMAIRWSDLQNAIREVQSHPGDTASIGPGVWLVIAGAVMLVVGGVRIQRRRLF